MTLWEKLSTKPMGKWIFGKLVCHNVPYFSTIKPRFEEFKPGFSRVSMKKRRAVENHIATVHAIAACNLAECGAGTLMEASAFSVLPSKPFVVPTSCFSQVRA